VELTPAVIDPVVAAALAEDVGAGDITTDRIVPSDARCRAEILLEEPGVVCGVPIVAAVFAALDAAVRVEQLVPEGARVGTAGTPVARIEGPARAVLTGERVALNLLGRLCGVATLTARYVDLASSTKTRILDTRKTTPGLRALERYAVGCGGGVNHRFGLNDAVLVKENHLRIAGGIAAAVAAVRAGGGDPVEVEAETIDEVAAALEAGVDRILLDNMSPEGVRRAVALVAGRAELEASGGVSLDTVSRYAETGVDFISIGALTHSARSLDVSLEIT